MARLKTLGTRLASSGSRLKVAPKRANSFYQSKAWLELRAARMCDGDYFAALRRRKSNDEKLILDHVREIKDGGAALDPANTQWLTHSEHQAKTAKARGERAAGRPAG